MPGGFKHIHKSWLVEPDLNVYLGTTIGKGEKKSYGCNLILTGAGFCAGKKASLIPQHDLWKMSTKILL